MRNIQNAIDIRTLSIGREDRVAGIAISALRMLHRLAHEASLTAGHAVTRTVKRAVMALLSVKASAVVVTLGYRTTFASWLCSRPERPPVLACCS